jgi:hypothetical protein
MAQHLRDLHQRDLRADHLAGHGVAQPVRPHLGDARSPAGPAHRRGDRAGRDRPERRDYLVRGRPAGRRLELFLRARAHDCL